MYYDTFKYPSEWTESWDSYTIHRPHVAKAIIEHMENYRTRLPMLHKQTEDLHERFFSAQGLVQQFNN